MHRIVPVRPALPGFAVVVSTLAATVAAAHPGHGAAPADTAAHYLTEPLHLALLVAAVVAAGAFVTLVRRRRRSDAR